MAYRYGPSGSMRRMGLALALLGAFAISAMGCSSTDDEFVERPVGEIYNDAMDELLAGNYAAAARQFDEVERQHPYSVWAAKAQLKAGFAHYQANRYSDAIATLNRFIDLHPGNRDIAYAYYLRALSYYEQISDVRRDQRMTELAYDALQEVVRRFPDSEYAEDAQQKLYLAEDHLAGKEMTVGRFYLRDGHYVAAINRFRNVVERYQTTSHVPEALHRLVEAYTALGVMDEATATAAVLGHNYPDTDWYADSYRLLNGEDMEPAADDGTWIGRVWNIFG